MSSACSTRSAMLPAASQSGTSPAPVDSTRRPVPLTSVSPIAEWPRPSRWPSLVQRHRLQIDRARLRRRPPSTTEAGVEVDVRLEQRAGRRRRAGTSRRRARVPGRADRGSRCVERPSASSGWLRVRPCALNDTGRPGTRVPGRGGAADGVAKACGADAADVALGDEVADRPGRPAHRHARSSDLDAELQIGVGAAPAAATSAAATITATARCTTPHRALLHGAHVGAEGRERLHGAAGAAAHDAGRRRRPRAPATARPAARPSAGRRPPR